METPYFETLNILLTPPHLKAANFQQLRLHCSTVS